MQGHSYNLVVTCPVAIPAPDPSVLSALGAGAVTNVSVSPSNVLSSGVWTISFTYVGASGVSVPSIPLPACTETLYDTTPVGVTLPPTTSPPAVITTLVPGQKYRLLVACVSPITAPNPMSVMGSLASAVSNVAVAPSAPAAATRTFWVIDFTYAGASPVPVPMFHAPSGCSVTLSYPTNIAVNA
jgi:hypothetical protein